jgi:hypothetical protein
VVNARRRRTALVAATLAVTAAWFVLVRPVARAQATSYGDGVTSVFTWPRALTADRFEYVAPRGFGDRNNSWAQAMFWWNNHLYVGTSRQ